MQKNTQNKKRTKNREEIYRIIDEKTKVISHPTTVYKTVTFVGSGFPEELFLQWKEVCQKQFNDIYWAKIWNDHVKAQAYDNIVAGGVQYVKETNSTADEETKENDAPIVFGDGE